jgi:hypothetical protein
MARASIAAARAAIGGGRSHRHGARSRHRRLALSRRPACWCGCRLSTGAKARQFSAPDVHDVDEVKALLAWIVDPVPVPDVFIQKTKGGGSVDRVGLLVPSASVDRYVTRADESNERGADRSFGVVGPDRAEDSRGRHSLRDRDPVLQTKVQERRFQILVRHRPSVSQSVAGGCRDSIKSGTSRDGCNAAAAVAVRGRRSCRRRRRKQRPIVAARREHPPRPRSPRLSGLPPGCRSLAPAQGNGRRMCPFSRTLAYDAGTGSGGSGSGSGAAGGGSAAGRGSCGSSGRTAGCGSSSGGG